MTSIEWTEATWNPIAGCSVLSPGCTNCYAMRTAARLARIEATAPIYAGLTQPSKAGPVWTGRIEVNEKAPLEPLRRRKPTMYFVNSMSDLFHESVPDEVIDRVFAVMALCAQHTFQVLTKRSARMRAYMTEAGADHPLDSRMARIQDAAYRIAATRTKKWDEAAGMRARAACLNALYRVDERTNAGCRNVWLGVSVEDQKRADERIPDLLNTPASVRFLSCEPLLGPVDLTQINHPSIDGACIDAMSGFHFSPGAISVPMTDNTYWSPDRGCHRLDWVIVGGESGPGARPMHPDWARDLRDQCADAGVPFFFKQWGSCLPCSWDGEDDTGGSGYILDEYYFGDGHHPDLGYARYVSAHGQEFARFARKKLPRTLDGVTHDAMPQVRP